MSTMPTYQTRHRRRKSSRSDGTFFSKESEREPDFFSGKSAGEKEAFFQPAMKYAEDAEGKPASGLPEDTRQKAARALGYSFNDVRIHTGPAAAASAEGLNAKAYSVGRNIVFGEGTYAPHTTAGAQLLSHELAHVAQVNSGQISASTISREMSTAVPKKAKLDDDGTARFAQGSIDIVVEPDKAMSAESETWHGSTAQPDADGAETLFFLDSSFTTDTANGNVTKVSLKHTLYIRTFYAKGVDPSADSTYGRGTTKADIKAKKTSLRHHEGAHGKDFQDYIKRVPPPGITVKLPASQDAFDKAVERWQAKKDAYNAALQAYSEKKTDETGVKKSSLKKP